MSQYTNCVKQLDDGGAVGYTTTLASGKSRRVQKTFQCGTPEQNKVAAQDWVHNHERIRSGLSPLIHQPTTLEELVEIYLESVQKDVKSDTHEWYQCLLSRVLTSFGPAHSPFLTQVEIDHYVDTKRANGAGRGITKELSCLRSALQSAHIVPDWAIPRQLYRIPKKESYVPNCREFRKLVDNLTQNASLAVHMALLSGLRDAEVYRVRWEHYNAVERLLSIPAEIRKNNQGNVVPVVDLLGNALDTHYKESLDLPDWTIIPCYPREVKSELRRVSTAIGIRPWYGLQPCRRLLCSLAEDAGYPLDTIALVTGHSRGSMVSRYSAAAGHMDLKREILEYVEQRLVA